MSFSQPMERPLGGLPASDPEALGFSSQRLARIGPQRRSLCTDVDRVSNFSTNHDLAIAKDFERMVYQALLGE
jgi:hypothetical protein